MDDIVNIAECLKNGRSIPLPQKTDQLHACCGAVAYQVKIAKGPRDFPVIAENFLKFVQTLPNDFAAMIMNDVENSLQNTKRWQMITANPLYHSVQQKYKPESLFDL